jgi:hypothetical protein
MAAGYYTTSDAFYKYNVVKYTSSTFQSGTQISIEIHEGLVRVVEVGGSTAGSTIRIMIGVVVGKGWPLLLVIPGP